jgi:hypothetical protein
MSAIKYMINRLHTYPMSKTHKKEEKYIIEQIMQQNQYQINKGTEKRKITKHSQIRQQEIHTQNTTEGKKEKWITLTYFGKETQQIAKIFKDTDIKIAFRTKNTLKKHLQPKQIGRNKYDNSGVYKLKCMDCSLQYIGQTGRSFKTRYKEHIRAIQYNKKENSTYAQHIIDTGHTYGTIQNTMEILHTTQKGKYMNCLEKFHIYCAHKDKKQMNEILFDTHNPVFDIIHSYQENNNTNAISHQ